MPDLTLSNPVDAFLQAANQAAMQSALGFGAAVVAAGKTILVDATNGDDGTGASGRLDKPFLTLGAAKTAANSGDTVFARPGSYAVTDSILKDGVGWVHPPGQSVAKTVTTGAIGIMDDAGAAVACDISGDADMLLTVNTNGSEADYVGTVRLTNASSNVTIRARSIGVSQIGSSINSPMAINASNGSLRVICSEAIYGEDTSVAMDGIGIYWEHGLCIVEAPQIWATQTPVWTQSSGTAVENIYIRAREIFATGAATNTFSPGVIFASNVATNPNAAVWVTADIIKAAAGSVYCSVGIGVGGEGDGKMYVQCQKLFGDVRCAGGDAALAYITSTKIEAIHNTGGGGVNALFAYVTNGTLRYDVGHHDPKAFTGPAFVVTGGTMLAQDIEYTSGSGSGGMVISGGTVTLRNCIIDTRANNGVDSITISDGTLELIDCVILAEAGRKDIVQSGGTVNISGGHGSGTSGHFTTTGTVNFLTPN